MRPARPATFVPTSGYRMTSSFAASTMSTTMGSGSYSTETSSAASTPVARSGLTTTATMSPTKRTTSLATTGRRIRCSSTGIGGGPVVTSMSSPVKTCTSGSASAADVSTPTTRAWARSERTNVIVSAPSSVRFSTYVASPRRKRGSSFRSTRFPRMLIRAEPIVARSGVQQLGRSIRAFAFSRPSAAEHRPHGGSHVGTPGRYVSSSGGLKGTGANGAPDPRYRRVQLVECCLLHLCDDLGAEPSVSHRLVRDDEPMRPASPMRRSPRRRGERASSGRSPRRRSPPRRAPRQRRATRGRGARERRW